MPDLSPVLSTPPETVSERFGALIRESRLALDPPMTQKDLADCVEVHQPSVSAWELGKTLPAPETMLKLASLFRLPLSDLIPLSDLVQRPGADQAPEAVAV